MIDTETGHEMVEVSGHDKKEYASKGVAGTGLGLGIAGTALRSASGAGRRGAGHTDRRLALLRRHSDAQPPRTGSSTSRRSWQECRRWRRCPGR